MFKANKKASNKNTQILFGLFKVNYRNTRTNFEIYSKVTIKTTERRH